VVEGGQFLGRGLRRIPNRGEEAIERLARFHSFQTIFNHPHPHPVRAAGAILLGGVEAAMRNVGTFGVDGNGKATSGMNHEDESTAEVLAQAKGDVQICV
jgi:hypothetical protein